jgi:hypothetical protein
MAGISPVTDYVNGIGPVCSKLLNAPNGALIDNDGLMPNLTRLMSDMSESAGIIKSFYRSILRDVAGTEYIDAGRSGGQSSAGKQLEGPRPGWGVFRA